MSANVSGISKFLTLLLLLMISKSAFAFEETLPRYALIIGNANYSFSPLKNPVNDANDMATKLRSLRYKVTVALDQNPEQIRKSVKSFYQSIKENNAVSLFYYAGHAIQANNINYLIPVNANITSFERMTTQSLSINEVLQALRQSPGDQNIIILDACRNNPFEAKAGSKNKRAIVIEDKKLQQLSRGLAPVEAPTGTLIAYATEPGNAAADGKGSNGTYTSALLRHIGKSETAEALFKEVRKDVLEATDEKQTPWEHSSLIKKFYFMPPSNEEIPDIVSF